MTPTGPVGVVVPMYNARKTISATLESILRQTYRDLEVVVVDDGSTDGSAAIVEEFARRDRRLRMVRQDNAGVAAARNAGAALCSGDILAFVDADDLWAPTKIARQLEVFEACPDVDVVYCWFALICEDDRSYPVWPSDKISGDVLQKLCRQNFIGNGSSLLMTRRAFESVGGYDPSLRARNGQGCEDWLISLRLAERYKFGLTPEFLVGYREHEQNMSSDIPQMLRSVDLVFAEYHEKYPQYTAELNEHRDDFILWMVRRAARVGRLETARKLAAQGSPEKAAEFAEAIRLSYRNHIKNTLVPKPIRNLVKLLPGLRGRIRPRYLDQFAIETMRAGAAAPSAAMKDGAGPVGAPRARRQASS